MDSISNAQLPVALLPTRAPELIWQSFGAIQRIIADVSGANDIVTVFEWLTAPWILIARLSRICMPRLDSNLLDRQSDRQYCFEVYERPNTTTRKYDLHVATNLVM